MKVLCRIVLSILLAGTCLNSSSQSTVNYSIGLQLNPYVNEFLFTSTFFEPVYAFRYTRVIKDHITLGPEISGFYVKARVNDYTFGNFNAGGFFRYSFLPESRIRPFIEVSPYFTYHYWKNYPESALTELESNGSKSVISGYIAPGITLYSKSRKISLDLFYKFSDRPFINNKQSVFSYRLNFNF